MQANSLNTESLFLGYTERRKSCSWMFIHNIYLCMNNMMRSYPSPNMRQNINKCMSECCVSSSWLRFTSGLVFRQRWHVCEMHKCRSSPHLSWRGFLKCDFQDYYTNSACYKSTNKTAGPNRHHKRENLQLLKAKTYWRLASFFLVFSSSGMSKDCRCFFLSALVRKPDNLKQTVYHSCQKWFIFRWVKLRVDQTLGHAQTNY